jgi:hypothetical protein
MPEVEILRVFHWPGDPATYTADNAAGDEIMSETEESDFGLAELDEIGREFGVTRWSEATDDERAEHEKSSYVADRLLLIGWAEAPITRDDVERSYHQGHNGEPMVNVKVQNFDLPKGDAFAELLAEFEGEMDPRLMALPHDELRELIEGFIEKDWSTFFGMACERGYEEAEEDAKYNCFPDRKVKVWSAGRSGGWLVVEGLPDVDSWDVKLLTAWSQFSAFCKDAVADVPRAMAWHVLANCQDDLAGRVVRVELTLTLSDDDLDKAGNDPTEWDWQDMLDLNDDSTINVRKI